jgi:hypothetical protein
MLRMREVVEVEKVVLGLKVEGENIYGKLQDFFMEWRVKNLKI